VSWGCQIQQYSGCQQSQDIFHRRNDVLVGCAAARSDSETWSINSGRQLAPQYRFRFSAGRRCAEFYKLRCDEFCPCNYVHRSVATGADMRAIAKNIWEKPGSENAVPGKSRTSRIWLSNPKATPTPQVDQANRGLSTQFWQDNSSSLGYRLNPLMTAADQMGAILKENLKTEISEI